MSTNNNDNKHYSAEDIRRYWQGELSAKEMHAMESAAMDDPFLADAMEGYSTVDAQTAAADVRVLREQLKERVGEHAAPRRNYWWRAAAVIILLAGMSALTYQLVLKNNNDKTVAQVNKEKAAQDTPAITIAPGMGADSITHQPGNTAQITDTALQGETYLAVKDNITARQYKYAPTKPATINTDDHLANLQTKPSSEALQLKTLTDTLKFSTSGINADKKDSVFIASSDAARNQRAENRLMQQNNAYNQPQSRAADRNADAFILNNFSGRVVDHNNQPIPYASVRVNNNNQAAATNNQGVFQLRSPDSVLDLSIASVGYRTQQLTLRNNQPSEVVMMPEDKKLSEVVVTGYGKQKKAASKSVSKAPDLKVYPMEAQPVGGWDEYNKYLNNNKRADSSRDVIKGEVIISFNVSKNGSLSSFEVEKSLSKQQDAEAIRLIKQGPAWIVLKGRKTRARVIVAF